METLEFNRRSYVKPPISLFDDFVEALRNHRKAEILCYGLGNRFAELLTCSLRNRYKKKLCMVSVNGVNEDANGKPLPVPARLAGISVQWDEWYESFLISVTLFTRPEIDQHVMMKREEEKVMSELQEAYDDPECCTFWNVKEYQAKAELLKNKRFRIDVFHMLSWKLTEDAVRDLLDGKMELKFTDDNGDIHTLDSFVSVPDAQ